MPETTVRLSVVGVDSSSLFASIRSQGVLQRATVSIASMSTSDADADNYVLRVSKTMLSVLANVMGTWLRGRANSVYIVVEQSDGATLRLYASEAKQGGTHPAAIRYVSENLQRLL